MNFYFEYFAKVDNCVRSVLRTEPSLEQACAIIDQVRVGNKKVILVGNGGSAAMASHISVDLVKIAGVRAVNFNESDLITCFANDYGYENWVTKAIEYYADEGDLAILISSSGKSKNILNGALKAKQKGLSVITFSGFSPDNPLRKLGDLNFWANSYEYNIVEMTHHVWLVALSDRLSMAGGGYAS